MRLPACFSCFPSSPCVPVAGGRPQCAGAEGPSRRGRSRCPVGGPHRNGGRSGTGRPRALRRGSDHGTGRRSQRLHPLQRVQFREQPGLDPRAAARRHAEAGQAGGPRSQLPARAAEDRPRPSAAGAGGGPAGGDVARAVVRGRGPHVRGVAAQHGRGHSQRRGPGVGQGPADRRPRLAQQLRRSAGRYPRPRDGPARAALAAVGRGNRRRRMVRFGHRFRRAPGGRSRRSSPSSARARICTRAWPASSCNRRISTRATP